MEPYFVSANSLLGMKTKTAGLSIGKLKQLTKIERVKNFLKLA